MPSDGALVPGNQTIVGNLTVAGEIIGFSNKVATDGNGDLRVANSKRVVFSIFDGKGVGFSRLRDETLTEGTGRVESSTEQSETNVVVNEAGGKAILSTARRGRCDVGRTVETGIALKTSGHELSHGQEIRWGYFDETDGFMFFLDSGGLGVAVDHSVKGLRTYRRSEWNIDRLDGLGPSGITFDPSSQITMYQILFTWGVSGVIVFRIILTNSEGDQFVQPVHRVQLHANGFETMNRFVLPVRCSVAWSGDAEESENENDDLKAIVVGRYFSIIGGTEQEAKWGTSTPPRLSTALSLSKGLGKFLRESDADLVHLLSVRRKSEFVDGGRIELSAIDILFENIVVDMMILLVQIRIDVMAAAASLSLLSDEGGSTTSEKWASLMFASAKETALEENTSNFDVSDKDGIVIFSTLVTAGRKESQKVTLTDLGLGMPEGISPITICIKALSIDQYTGAIGSGVTSFIGRASCVARLMEAW